MTTELITVGTAAAAITSALVAGIAFAFSTSVTPGLRRRPAPEAIAAMQDINSASANPAFGLAFVAAALLCALLMLAAPFTIDEPHALLRGAGAALRVVGTFAVTIAVNVPMNAELHSVDACTAPKLVRSGTATSADGRRGTPLERSSVPAPRHC